jgi:hypothetical protein
VLLSTAALVLLLADGGRVTLPRTLDPALAEKPTPDAAQTTDPLFDRPLRARDDAAFVRDLVESLRQGVVDARAGESGLPTPELRAAASAIGEQEAATLESVETLATRKGWRLPEGNPVRSGSVPVAGEARTSANFIIHQITRHQTVISHVKAQLEGQGDAQLKRELRAALPRYQKNLRMLLELKL